MKLLITSVLLILSTWGFLAREASSQENHQTYMYEFLDSEQGLSNNYVTGILQDNKGFIWIATESGLTKYNGIDFLVYGNVNNDRNGVSYDNIETLFKDRNGNIWIGKKVGGISYLEISTNKTLNFNNNSDDSPQLMADRILSFGESDDGSIYAGGWQGGVDVIDVESMKIRNHILGNETVYVIFRDQSYNLWFGTDRNLYQLPSGSEIPEKFPIDFNGIISIEADTANNSLWIGSWRGFYSFDIKRGQFEKIELFPEIQNVAIKSLLVRNGVLWIGTWGQGLYRFNTASAEIENMNMSVNCAEFLNPNYNTVLDLFQDKYGTIWVSTTNGIVKIIAKQPFKTICAGPGDEPSYINTTSLYTEDLLSMIGTDRGLIVKGKAGSEYYQIGRVNSIIPVSKDSVYICAASGFYLFHSDIRTLEPNIPNLKEVMHFFQEEEEIAWICTKQTGVYRFRIENGQFIQEKNYQIDPDKKNALKSNRAVEIVSDHLGQLWLATYNGLHIYNPSLDQFIPADAMHSELSISSPIINDLTFKDERLYVGTSSGLNIIELSEDYHLITINSDLGVSNNYINALELDKQNNIWASTNYGINRYHFLDYSVKNYNTSDGTFTNSFKEHAVHRAIDGEIYFGSQKGPVYFHPDSIRDSQTFPGIIFTNIMINNQVISAGDTINNRIILTRPLEYEKELFLSHYDKVIAINISPDDFIQKGNIYYKYRLKGFQEDWSYNFNIKTLTYSNLNPGNYSLEVFGSRIRNQWPGVAAELQIKVKPAPWYTWWAYTIYLLIITGLVYSFWRTLNRSVVLRHKLKLETFEKTKEMELAEAKLKFFTNISHEFRTPLTLIHGPVEDILASSGLDNKLRNKLSLVYQNSLRLMNLINQLLEFRKITTGNDRLQAASGNYNKFINEIFLSFKELAADRSINYSFNAVTPDIQLWYDRNKMEILVYNLLSNAFKYTPEGGTIEIKVEISGHSCILQVRDTGRGISIRDQQRIFNRFVQLKSEDSNTVPGSGIGLSVTKAIAELHQGTISVDSEEGRGSTFTATFPLGNSHLSPEQIQREYMNSEHIQHYQVIPDHPDHEPAHSALDSDEYPMVLIIDDNPDIRRYIRYLLEEDYLVAEAEDGIRGLELIQSKIPDLIISDVMMPGLDGIELCKKVKLDDSTSHIPIILLTARTSNIYQISGIKTGADDYITKPFAPEILKVRIANLLSTREKLKEYYSQKITLESSNIEIPDREAEFIKNAISQVEEHISETDFGINDLQNALNMSQATLYRKLKALTNESPTAFIRSIRLKYAAQLLSNGNCNVNDAIYSSGFNDVKYFRECFKKQFGCLPSKYVETRLEAP